MFPHQLNSKNNVPLLSVATEDKDGRGLKLEKIRPTVNAVPAKVRQKIHTFFLTLQEHFVYV